jgi:folate-binding protein YgfZ
MAALRDEYRIIADRAGWIERRDRGRIRLEGSDAGTFLQALVTNDVAGLSPGDGRHAAYLTPNGRMLADLAVFRRPDHWLLGLAAGQAAAIAARLDQLIFSEDVRVRDETAGTAEVAVIGGDAIAHVSRLLSMPEHALATLGELRQSDWDGGFVARTADALLPGFLIVVPSQERSRLVDDLRRLDHEMSVELLEALRIEAGRPRYGVDVTEETIPLEAGLLDRSISTTKGCYVGQEIIIRILHRGGGRVARRLVTLAFDPPTDELPSAGTVLRVGHAITGVLTSVSPSPRLASAIGLGYVHRDHAEIGREVTIGGSGLRAEITGFAR